MTFKAPAVALVGLLSGGLSACDGSVTSPTPLAATTARPAPPGSGTLLPAFRVAEVILSGVVFERTTHGRTPLAGVLVANGEGNAAMTDANGFYSFGPVWVCPCAAQPWVEAGTTFLWVTKDGYTDPDGTPGSVFRPGALTHGTRDVRIDGNTRYDIELVRR